jgi:hypothetical protein
MKKLLTSCSLLLGLLLILNSCSKDPDKIMDNKNGKWDAIITYKYYEDGDLVDQDVSAGTFIFEESTFTAIIDGFSEQGTWKATKDKVTLIVDNDPLIFDVIKSSKKRQEWEFKDKGQNWEDVLTIELTR